MAQTHTWVTDPAHTSVQFTVPHMVISTVTGKFEEFSGTVVITDDDFLTAQIEGNVQVNSINTGIERRDAHLKSGDFFLVDEYPEMTFKSTKVEKTGDNLYSITGDLTIRGITKAVVFEAKHGGTITAFGTQHMGWEATATVNRFDFGLHWNKALDTGGLIAGDRVTITIVTEFIRQD